MESHFQVDTVSPPVPLDFSQKTTLFDGSKREKIIIQGLKVCITGVPRAISMLGEHNRIIHNHVSQQSAVTLKKNHSEADLIQNEPIQMTDAL